LIVYRVCKHFEFQAAHVLGKHPGRCRYPHGHGYRVEVVLAAERLDDNDMVCDFGAIKAIVEECLDGWDHAMMINSADTRTVETQAENPRKVVFQDRDPSSEVLARELFEHIVRRLAQPTVENRHGVRYKLNPYAHLEKVRVWETSGAWAEYEAD